MFNESIIFQVSDRNIADNLRLEILQNTGKSQVSHWSNGGLHVVFDRKDLEVANKYKRAIPWKWGY